MAQPAAAIDYSKQPDNLEYDNGSATSDRIGGVNYVTVTFEGGKTIGVKVDKGESKTYYLPVSGCDGKISVKGGDETVKTGFNSKMDYVKLDFEYENGVRWFLKAYKQK